MGTLTRRHAMSLIGIGIGTAIADVITPGSLLAQTRDRLAIGTAGKGGVFYPLGNSLANVISKYSPGHERRSRFFHTISSRRGALLQGKGHHRAVSLNELVHKDASMTLDRYSRVVLTVLAVCLVEPATSSGDRQLKRQGQCYFTLAKGGAWQFV